MGIDSPNVCVCHDQRSNVESHPWATSCTKNPKRRFLHSWFISGKLYNSTNRKLCCILNECGYSLLMDQITNTLFIYIGPIRAGDILCFTSLWSDCTRHDFANRCSSRKRRCWEKKTFCCGWTCFGSILLLPNVINL